MSFDNVCLLWVMVKPLQGKLILNRNRYFFFTIFCGCRLQATNKKGKKKDKVHTQTKIGILQYELLNDYMKHYNKKKNLQHQIISWLPANSPVEWIS